MHCQFSYSPPFLGGGRGRRENQLNEWINDLEIICVGHTILFLRIAENPNFYIFNCRGSSWKISVKQIMKIIYSTSRLILFLLLHNYFWWVITRLSHLYSRGGYLLNTFFGNRFVSSFNLDWSIFFFFFFFIFYSIKSIFMAFNRHALKVLSMFSQMQYFKWVWVIYTEIAFSHKFLLKLTFGTNDPW